jgi:phospholipid transport system substrate-binding protein
MRRHPRRWTAMTVAGILTAATLVGLPRPARAGAPTDQVKQYTDEVVRILDDPAMRSADKRAAVRKVAGDVFDLTETAKRALGRHWQGRTAAEREEFVQLFADLLERTYISKIDLYGGERVKYVGETIDGGYAVVKGRVVTKKGTEVPVDARLLNRNGRWLIYDVTVENVSLVGNYRAQFDHILRTSSFQELLNRLRSRRDEFLDGKETRAGRG